MASASIPSANTSTRVHVFDAVRGFSVISMIGFHLCYDLKFIIGMPLPWFAPPFQDIWRASISWTFVFIAGCMVAWSRDNLRRSARYLLAALVVFVVTTVVAVDVPINFGIIYCMGACTLTCWLLERMGFRPRGPLPALLLFALFLVCLHIPHGELGLGAFSVRIPRVLYSTPYLSWLGFPGPGFASGDYYPLLPFLLLFLSGSSMGRYWHEVGMPSWCHKQAFPALEAIGRHALPIYLLHQPVLFLALQPFMH